MAKFKVFADDPDKLKQTCEEMFEEFLDEVFDVSSRVTRQTFMEQLVKNSKYLFNPSELRQKVLDSMN